MNIVHIHMATKRLEVFRVFMIMLFVHFNIMQETSSSPTAIRLDVKSRTEASF